ncbi:MAG: sigma-E factor negative regulatory protein, partial [Alloalcanivorax xenomutans]
MKRDFEVLSALLDGETNEFETRRVLRDLDENGLDTLARWQLTRDVMHGQAVRPVPSSFTARLSEALAA